MKGLPKKISLLKTLTETEYQALDQDNGLEAKIFRDESRSTLTLNLWEIPQQLNRTSLSDQTQHTGTTIRISEDHGDQRPNQSYNKNDGNRSWNEIDNILEKSLFLNRPNGEISHRTIHTANHEVISWTFLLAEITNNLRVVWPLTNKNSHQPKTRVHPMSSASLQPTIALMKYQTFDHYTTKVSEHELWWIAKI